jgi:ketosteroid isomerase-like protein
MLPAWGDSAYTVSIERDAASVVGGLPEQFEVRSTHRFRREARRWLAMHRHADRQALEPAPSPNATG